MKKFFKIILGIASAFILAIAAIFYSTSGMLVTTAADFFEAIKTKDMDKAYTYLSPEFQSGASKSDLKQYMEKHSINKLMKVNWESRSLDDSRGSLVGSITTDSDGVVPVILGFVKSENGWEIYSIQKPSSGFQDESQSVEIPNEDEQLRLVSETMMSFAESVNEKSMAKFHNHISYLWRQQASQEQFENAFGSFFEAGDDLTVLSGFSPVFNEKPALDEEGNLMISGVYPTNPDKVHFTHKYTYEGFGWKLVGFSAQVN